LRNFGQASRAAADKLGTPKAEVQVRASSIQRYQKRFQRVLAYIGRHLESDLSIEVLSAVAACSKFHFHRQFTALFGISVHQHVQLARLKRASFRLAFRPGTSVTDIALAGGYAAPEAFSRAFRQRFGQSPSAFRAHPHWLSWQAALQPIQRERSISMQAFQIDQVKIIATEDQRVALLEHRGDPALLGDTIRRFIAWRRAAGLPPRRSATFNIWYNDPQRVAPEAFRLGLCAATDGEIAPNSAGVVPAMIPGGRCAVLRHVGTDASLQAAAEFLYAVWLPASGKALRDFPPYCQRLSFYPDVPEQEAVTDIFLPLI
jgi:AraC family transcriptional regulator